MSVAGFRPLVPSNTLRMRMRRYSFTDRKHTNHSPFLKFCKYNFKDKPLGPAKVRQLVHNCWIFEVGEKVHF